MLLGELPPSHGMDLLVASVDPDDVIDEAASVLRPARVGVRRRGQSEMHGPTKACTSVK